MVLPRSAGTFLISRPAISCNEAAVSTSNTISAASSSRIVTRSFRVQPMSGLLRLFDHDPVLAVMFSQAHRDALALGCRQVLADVVGANRQLAVPTIDEDGELDHLGPSEIDEGVERGPDRPPGEQHIVDQDHRLVLD